METEIIIGVLGVISTIITWFLSKRKYSAETDSIIVENIERLLASYKEAKEYDTQRISDLIAENSAMVKEIGELKAQVASLTEEIKELRASSNTREKAKTAAKPTKKTK